MEHHLMTFMIINPQISDLIDKITKDQDVTEKTWLTNFFTHDIFILGLSMSFLEIELWWLLSYRRRFMLEYPEYKISNKIYYFYAIAKDCHDDEQLSLLESMGVELKPIPLIRNNWTKLYLKILSEIETIIDKRSKLNV